MSYLNDCTRAVVISRLPKNRKNLSMTCDRCSGKEEALMELSPAIVVMKRDRGGSCRHILQVNAFLSTRPFLSS